MRGPAPSVADHHCDGPEVARVGLQALEVEAQPLAGRECEIVGSDQLALREFDVFDVRVEQHATEAGVGNVEFLHGHIESIPLPDASVDVVISNCVINLSPDKPTVFAEMFRVLRPGGSIGVSDVVTDDHLTADERLERGSYVGCIAGALPITEYETGLRNAGFSDVTITFTNTVGDGVHSAIVKAAKPAAR